MNPKRKNRRNFCIALVIGLVVAVALFVGRGGLDVATREEMAFLMCDACFVPAVILLGVGLILFVSNDGLFDMLGYGIQRALTIMLSEKKRAKYPRTFYEYKQLKWDAPKSSFGFLLLAGGVYLVLAAVFLVFSGALA